MDWLPWATFAAGGLLGWFGHRLNREQWKWQKAAPEREARIAAVSEAWAALDRAKESVQNEAISGSNAGYIEAAKLVFILDEHATRLTYALGEEGKHFTIAYQNAIAALNMA